MKQQLAIFFGGESYEYSVSLESVSSVLQHIDTSNYEIIPIGISKQGEWFYYGGELSKIEKDTWMDDSLCKPCTLSFDRKKKGILILEDEKTSFLNIDLALIILHGRNGEDGSLQGALQLSHIPYVGCGVLASSLCMDKVRSHKLVESYGIRVPQSISFKNSLNQAQLNEFVEKVGFPLFVKPVKAGSSYGISKVEKECDLITAISYAFEFDDVVVVEEAIDGFEVGCAILEKDGLLAGRVDEIELSQGFFNFEEKYTLKTSKIHVPARINEQEEKRIIETAKEIYQILDCKDFARVDLFYTSNHEIVFNEINTIPGFTSHSRYPSMMKEAGISFEELLSTLLETGGHA